MKIEEIFKFCDKYKYISLNLLDNQLEIYRFIYNSVNYKGKKFQDLGEKQRYLIIKRLYDSIYQKKEYLHNLDLILKKLDLNLNFTYKDIVQLYFKYLLLSNNVKEAKIIAFRDIEPGFEEIKYNANKIIDKINDFLIKNGIDI